MSSPYDFDKVEAILDAIADLRPGELLELSRRINASMVDLAQATMIGARALYHVVADYEKSGIKSKKIQTIKLIRAITKFGLKEAKDVVDQLEMVKYGPVLEGVTEDVADQVIRMFESEGITVEKELAA